MQDAHGQANDDSEKFEENAIAPKADVQDDRACRFGEFAALIRAERDEEYFVVRLVMRQAAPIFIPVGHL